MHFLHLIDCVLSLDLHVHGNKEGEEEENSTGESHQLRGRQLSVWPHTGLNFTILKMMKKLSKIIKKLSKVIKKLSTPPILKMIKLFPKQFQGEE